MEVRSWSGADTFWHILKTIKSTDRFVRPVRPIATSSADSYVQGLQPWGELRGSTANSCPNLEYHFFCRTPKAVVLC